MDNSLNPLSMIVVAFALLRLGIVGMKSVAELEFKRLKVNLFTNDFLRDTHHLCNIAQVILKEMVEPLGQLFLV